MTQPLGLNREVVTRGSVSALARLLTHPGGTLHSPLRRVPAPEIVGLSRGALPPISRGRQIVDLTNSSTSPMTQAVAEIDTVLRVRPHFAVLLAPLGLMILPVMFVVWANWHASWYVAHMEAVIGVKIPTVPFPVTTAVWVALIPYSLPGLLLVLIMIFEIRNLAHTVTTTHLQFKSGWFCLGRGEVRLADLEAAFMIESFVGSVLGYGKVKVTVKGGAVLTVRFVPQSRQFCMQLQHAIGSVRAGREPLPLQVAVSALPSTPGKAGYPLGNGLSDLAYNLSQTAQDDSRYMPKG
jgi:hypothetical protein